LSTLVRAARVDKRRGGRVKMAARKRKQQMNGSFNKSTKLLLTTPPARRAP
jgi:hypothetical protein